MVKHYYNQGIGEGRAERRQLSVGAIVGARQHYRFLAGIARAVGGKRNLRALALGRARGMGR